MKKIVFILLFCATFSSFAINHIPAKKPKAYMLTHNLGADAVAFSAQYTGPGTTIVGFFMQNVYYSLAGFGTGSSDCSGFSTTGVNTGFFIPARTLSTNDVVKIGKNALYSYIWNVYSWNEIGLPGASSTGSMKINIIRVYPSDTSQTATGPQITDTTSSSVCIPITCDDSALTCTATNPDDVYQFGDS